jgi:peptide/nickel transport system ATP-binding protein
LPTKRDTGPALDRDAVDGPEPLLAVRDLEVHFALQGNFVQRLLSRETGTVKAVDGVSFDVQPGEVLAVVGESGSGKTTLGRALTGLVATSDGSIRYRGQEVADMSDRSFRPLRRKIQMVFQDPHASLNPAMDLETALAHPLRIHGVADRAETHRLVRDALERVGLSPVERFLGKLPGDLSGGQKQRAVIARAIILGPDLLVADEPVSMLDMSVRAKILQLMLDLKRDLDLTYVYITHDLATAKFFCDRVAIMYLGRVVEIGPTSQIFADPKHPYTRALLAAIPDPDPERSLPTDLPRGEIPDAAEPPSGCAFHPRCPAAFDRCGWEGRDLRSLLESHWLTVDEEVYERERAVVGTLDELSAPGATARISPQGGHSVTDVRSVLDRVRAADPDEPFWRGVTSIDDDGSAVTVHFAAGEDPALRTSGGVEVACLLYEPEGQGQDTR